MTSADQVREALADLGGDSDPLELLPYLIDACREAGLLVDSGEEGEVGSVVGD